MKTIGWRWVLFLLGVLCWGIFGVIGSTIDQDGLLVEPFFLIPLGYLFISLFVIAVVGQTLVRFLVRRAKKKTPESRID